jgi:hypothetical protein
MVETQNDNDGEHQTNTKVVLTINKENINVNSIDEQGLNALKRRRHDFGIVKPIGNLLKKPRLWLMEEMVLKPLI